MTYSKIRKFIKLYVNLSEFHWNVTQRSVKIHVCEHLEEQVDGKSPLKILERIHHESFVAIYYHLVIWLEKLLEFLKLDGVFQFLKNLGLLKIWFEAVVQKSVGFDLANGKYGSQAVPTLFVVGILGGIERLLFSRLKIFVRDANVNKYFVWVENLEVRYLFRVVHWFHIENLMAVPLLDHEFQRFVIQILNGLFW